MSSLAPSAWFLLLVHFIPCSRSEGSELLNPRAVSTAPTGPWVIVLQALQVEIRVERAGMFCSGRDSAHHPWLSNCWSGTASFSHLEEAFRIRLLQSQDQDWGQCYSGGSGLVCPCW